MNADALLHHLTHVVADRKEAVVERDKAEARVRGLNRQLYEALTGAKSVREQLMDGTTVSIVRSKARETVLPEKLLALGVDPDVIRAATKETPVAPFVRVDSRNSGVEHATQNIPDVSMYGVPEEADPTDH